MKPTPVDLAICATNKLAGTVPGHDAEAVDPAVVRAFHIREVQRIEQDAPELLRGIGFDRDLGVVRHVFSGGVRRAGLDLNWREAGDRVYFFESAGAMTAVASSSIFAGLSSRSLTKTRLIAG